MGEQISFPDEYQRLLRQADLAIAQADFLLAEKQLKKAYQLMADFALNLRLTKMLEKNGAYQAALALADEYYGHYFQEQVTFEHYFHLLLLNRQFLTAKKYLHLGETHAKSTRHLAEELTLLEEVQKLLSQDEEVNKRQLLEQMCQAQQPITTKQWCDFSEGMTCAQFVRLVQVVLIKELNPFLRPKLVEELVKLKVSTPIEVQDLWGVQQQVIPANLPLPQDVPLLKQTLALLEEQLAQTDPQLAEGIAQEITAHVSLSYPVMFEKIEPALWLQSYYADYQAFLPERFHGCVKNEAALLACQKIKQDLRNLFG
ncbi:MAG: hypothetical protein ACK5MW_06675 [Enterococcus sp.]